MTEESSYHLEIVVKRTGKLFTTVIFSREIQKKDLIKVKKAIRSFD